MTKAVTTALGRNPKVKTKGESMCNGFKSLLPTATIELYHNLSGGCQGVAQFICAICATFVQLVQLSGR